MQAVKLLRDEQIWAHAQRLDAAMACVPTVKLAEGELVLWVCNRPRRVQLPSNWKFEQNYWGDYCVAGLYSDLLFIRVESQ